MLQTAERPALRPPRAWTVARVAAFFADRIGAPRLSSDFFADLGMGPDERIAADSAPQAARMMAGVLALAGGVAPAILEPFVAKRHDLVDACAAAISPAFDAGDLRFTFEHGVMSVVVHVPASFIGALKVLLARIREELDEQAA